MDRVRRRLFVGCPVVATVVLLAVPSAGADDPNQACAECHGSADQAAAAAEAFELTLTAEQVARLAVALPPGCVHEDVGCVGCHAGAEEIPHPENLLAGNPCASCHSDAVTAVNTSVHGDASGGNEPVAACWGCHDPHDCRPPKVEASALSPAHVAGRCLQCHDQREYLVGVHGHAVQQAGLDVAATCVSCHGAHDVQSSQMIGSRTKRRNVSFTCGKCHGRVAEAYRTSVHGAALMKDDNPDVPTCVDCHEPHGTRDPNQTQFRVSSPEICGKCHGNAEMMSKYGLSTAVFSTYVADFHGTTAELFRAITPNQPLNQAVCYDCHGVHDIQAMRGAGQKQINARMLERCQVCHPAATARFLSAWTSHYVPSRDRYPMIYWVNVFYQLVIPGTVGFFLLYIAVDWLARRRGQRRSA
jgi:predicted CXXCH cytochrome family protein